MHLGDGDGARRRTQRKQRAHAHARRLTKALAVLGALAGVHCSGGDDDDDMQFDDSAGQSSLHAGTGGASGMSGGAPAAGTAPTLGGAGAFGGTSASGKGGDGGTSGTNMSGLGGVAAAGQSGGGVSGRAGAASGGTNSGGRGGRGGRGGSAGTPTGTGGASAGSAGTAGSGQSWDHAETLDAHNDVRAMVTMGAALPALTWSETLAAQAQDWAETLAEECDGIRHRMPNDYGENITAQWFSGNAPAPSPERYGPDAVAAWAEEIECWEYGTISGTETCNQQCIQMQNSNGCGHYTQLVWRNSRQVGCGYATCRPESNELMEIFVCNYNPPGNIQTQAPY